ncbi:MAG: ABC transporter ATP-binding protein [Saprospiraceae bacterium]|nr:ABC transporter ATP-binding protein [Saprospiraceae bacterium]MCF8251718.1 ABC transporter ATP-binding protein [Saprospiraceae bacterium]MCF8311772.1 ABC transporter ATP-binding protein [Saprospiraceae bacterium]MCF8441778.1 ABC transporter ATP-binding protein [Saprospiraceae bacterium]
MLDNLLTINNLRVSFPSEIGKVDALRGISFSLKKGETLGIVGESGSGKSMTALAIMGLLPAAANLEAGEILFEGKDGRILNPASVIGSEIAMIFQEPMTSLNPVFRCGDQVAEAILLHQKTTKGIAKQQTLQLFEKVKLPDPERIWRSYPHQLSGGQRQRVMIAMTLSCNPSLLIADEPTSALDVTVQRSILDLFNELKNEWGGSTIFISHDLGVVAEVADNVLVMQKGEIVEHGSVAQIFQNPKHPYTQLLLENFKKRTSLSTAHRQPSTVNHLPILSISKLRTWFPSRRNFFGKPIEHVKAVDNVSFEVFDGETLGLVGESGSGKTTLGRSILKLINPSSGEVIFSSKNILQQTENEWFSTRKDIQVIFQDPYSSLNPRQPIGTAITEPMQVHGLFSNEKQRREKAVELLETVGLEASHFWRFPSEFSGGQRQRICIARALALQPKIIICDEAISSLDVTVQAQVLDLLQVLQKKHRLTYIFISHDLSVVRLISDRIAVMKDGKIVEIGPTDEVFSNPKSDYTRELLEAIPHVDWKN